jgi:hypothetical protein
MPPAGDDICHYGSAADLITIERVDRLAGDIGQKVDQVRVTSASEPGSPDKPNEDGLVVTADMLAVLL